MAVSYLHSDHASTIRPNSTATDLIESGYNTPVYGLANGRFLSIHIPALICIFLSLFSALAVIVASFKHQKVNTFFSWTKSERFAVYIAICDGLFNICHSLDHLHILVTKNHVYPKGLCIFYGFMLAEMITAQNLLVNVVSINAFVIVYFRKNLDFGWYDWKLLCWMFGMPCVAGIIAVSWDTMGPNGAFCYFDSIKGELANIFFTTIPLLIILMMNSTICYFDSIKGELANIFFTTIPLLIILMMNSTLYILTWFRLRAEEPRFKNLAGDDARIIRASHKAAKCMSLFVMAFFIQWCAMAIYGVWQIVDYNVPMTVFQFVTTFSNIGGILNGIVYFIIRRKQLVKRPTVVDNGSRKNTVNKHDRPVMQLKKQDTFEPLQNHPYHPHEKYVCTL